MFQIALKSCQNPEIPYEITDQTFLMGTVSAGL